MNTNNKKLKGKIYRSIGSDFVVRFWEESWTYIKTVVDVVREPILILNKNLQIVAANEPFYKTFRVDPKDTIHKNIYELGNGQWNIPALRKLLEDILPKNTFFKGFEVAHEFPFIGRKVMILNARQIHYKEDSSAELAPPIILLAIEDVTEMLAVGELLAGHLKQSESKLMERTQLLEIHIEKLEKEIDKLKKATAKK